LRSSFQRESRHRGCYPSARRLDERGAAAKKVRSSFRGLLAHRFYRELFFKQGLFSQPVREEYRALLDEHPDDLTFLALYARTLKGTNTPRPSSC
jgi:hypothetical protein